MITKLTKEQEDLLPVVRDKWIAIGLSTHPMDFEKVRDKLIPAYYNAGGLEAPKTVVYCRSPKEMFEKVHKDKKALNSSVHSAVNSAVHSAVHSAVGSAVGSAVRSAVHSAVGSAVRSAVHSAVGLAVDSAVHSAVGSAVWINYVGGNLWAAWQAHYDYFIQIGVEGLDVIKPTLELSEECGWLYPAKEVCYVTDKPEFIHLNEDDVLHSLNGPAMKWRDGFEIYTINGVKATDEQIAEIKRRISFHNTIEEFLEA